MTTSKRSTLACCPHCGGNVSEKINAVAKVAQIYFEIAASEIGEDEVRRMRDEKITVLTDRNKNADT